MYPSGELSRLAARKSRLQEHAARRRAACVVLCRRLSGPVEKIDAWRARLRSFRTYLPLGAAAFSLWRRPRPRATERSAGGWMRWLPVVVEGMRLFRK